MTSAIDQALWPRPRKLRVTGDHVGLPAKPVVACTDPGAADPAVARLRRGLEELGLAPEISPERRACDVELRLDGRDLPGPDAYRLTLEPTRCELVAGDRAGLFHAAGTLLQWLRGNDVRPGRSVPAVRIEDHPDFVHRGVLLDVSRNRVPTMETLFALVDRFADWKLNQLQLYTEHTFAYAGHEIVWRQADPLTAEEIRRLDRYCRRRCVELVPNQNSFGHFHRWLVHEPYRRLAECPEGVRHPFSDAVEPFSLCPGDEGALELLGDLYDQLLPNFSSRMMNAGLDETFDLGRGRSAAICAERGRAAVYLDHLTRVHAMLAGRGRRLQFWGDIVLEHPELIDALPRDAIPLAWGYEADHPFAEELPHFAESGLDFYVCPGTSSWNSLSGRSRNALLNLSGAASAGRESGALGYLIADWGDFGHLQPLAASWPGFLAGAGFAWNADTVGTAPEPDMAGLLAHHVLGVDQQELGRTLFELGDVHRLAGPEIRNGTALFFLLVKAGEDLTHKRYDGLSVTGLHRAGERLAELADGLPRPSPAFSESGRTSRELSWVAAILDLACRMGELRLRQGRERHLGELPAGERRVLAARLGPLVNELPDLWLTRSRAGGMRDSVARLERLRQLLIG